MFSMGVPKHQSNVFVLLSGSNMASKAGNGVMAVHGAISVVTLLLVSEHSEVREGPEKR